MLLEQCKIQKLLDLTNRLEQREVHSLNSKYRTSCSNVVFYILNPEVSVMDILNPTQLDMRQDT